jgi:hypothetical protein
VILGFMLRGLQGHTFGVEEVAKRQGTVAEQRALFFKINRSSRAGRRGGRGR